VALKVTTALSVPRESEEVILLPPLAALRLVSFADLFLIHLFIVQVLFAPHTVVPLHPK